MPGQRVLIAGLLLLLSLGTAGYGPPVLTDGRQPALRLYPEQVRAMRALSQPPAISALAGLMVDLGSGQTLYALRPHDRLPPASTVKIMTALLALQRANLDAVVTVSAAAANASGSRMGLGAGEKLTVRDLLYGLLLPSGNDAAVALAEHIGGSQASFVTMMNEAAAGLGLGQTRFANPHGLDDPAQTTSAADLVTLTRAALAYPAFARIVAAEQANTANRSLANTNQLLSIYRGADGVKTGTTAAAGECLVASVTRNGHRVLVVVLGSRDRYADAVALLEYAAAGWSWRPAALPDNALGWEIGADGRAYRLAAADKADLFLPTWQWRLVQPVRVLSADTPLTSTLPVGLLHYMLDGRVLATVPLTVWQKP